MVAAATATALTGALVTSVWVGRTMRRTLQEKRIKDGLANPSNGGLGHVLKRWNETVFHDLGVFVHFELSESARKKPDQKTKFVRKSALLYSKREDRDRKRDERKFCIVVTKLSDEGEPEDAVLELAAGPDIAEAHPSTLSSDDVMYQMAELPGDYGAVAVELPADDTTATATFSHVGNYQKMSEYAEPPPDVLADAWARRRQFSWVEGDEAALRAPLVVNGHVHPVLAPDKEQVG